MPVVPALVLAWTLAAGCDAAPADLAPVAVTDSAGVEIVRNRPPSAPGIEDDAPLAHITLEGEPMVRVGSDEEGPELFGGIGAARIDPLGRLWVMDQVAREFRVFGLPRGEHVFTFGGQGEGPGEFQQPALLGFDRDGTAWLWDQRLARLSALDPVGTLRETLRPGQDRELSPRLLARTPRGTFVGQLPQLFTGEVTDGMILQDTLTLRELDASGEELRVLARRRGQTWYFRDRVQAPVPFAEGARFQARDDRIVLTHPAGEPVLEVVDEGRLVRRIHLEREPERVTGRIVDEELDGPTRTPAAAALLREHRAELPIPDSRPAWNWVRLGPAGEIFALRHGTLLSGEVWDVFDPDGRWRGTLELPDEHHLMDVGRGLLVVTEMAELRGPRVAVFGFELGSRPDTTFHPMPPGAGHRMWAPEWDVGVGFVRLLPLPEGPPGLARSDTVPIHSSPRSAAPAVARFHHREFVLTVEATERGLEGAALEVGYEERAFPLLEETPDGRWARILFAYDEEGGARSGWVDLSGPGIERVFWPEWLADAPGRGALYFARPADIAFRSEPDGAAVELTLTPGAGSWEYDYALHPLRVEGRWMEVRVVSPSDYCADPDSPLEATAWIRFLDDRDRPRVWYFTRGC